MKDTEKLSQNSERVEFSQGQIDKHQERLQTERERSAERGQEASKEREALARHEIEKATAEKEPKEHETNTEQSPAERRVNTVAARKKAYNSIMKQTQAELSAPSRAFSKFIHNPAVEKVSEVAGNTIARPNAMLAGATFAFLLTLAIYLIARFNGYPLSGTETIAAFIAGWIIGNLYDFFKTMATGKRQLAHLY